MRKPVALDQTSINTHDAKNEKSISILNCTRAGITLKLSVASVYTIKLYSVAGKNVFNTCIHSPVLVKQFSFSRK